MPSGSLRAQVEKAMRLRPAVCLFVALTVGSMGMAQADDPVKKLGAFLGKWQSEAALAGSDNKVTSTLECRWSSQGTYRGCEQVIKIGDGEHRQLTVYSHNRKDGTYSYVTVSDPGAKPTSGTVAIHGNIWTYSSSFENNGTTVQIRTTNDFTDPKTEVFSVESSRDGGVTSVTFLSSAAHKTAD